MDILLLDDDVDSRRYLVRFLQSLGHHVEEYSDGDAGVRAFMAGKFSMVLSDILMPGKTGIDFLQAIASHPGRGDTSVVLMTANANIETALSALRLGAYDYITKPINLDGLAAIVERAAGYQGLRRDNRRLIEEMVAMNEILENANQLLEEENKLRQQMEDNLLLRERQYRATTSLLTCPVEEFEGFLESILRDALQLVKAPDGYIVLCDNGTQTYSIHHGIGLYESWIMEPRAAESGMHEYVYKTGNILTVNDYRQYPERINDKRLDRLTSAIMLPLKQEGQVQGMLCASWSDVVHPISTDDVEVLRQFCDLATVALERTNAQKKINHMAFYDTLTGLPNRASLIKHIEQEMKKTQCGKALGAIVFINMDDLKSVNDNFGNSFGDSVIIAAGRHIVGALGEKAFVAHSGGDEFIIVLSGGYGREEIAHNADMILDALCQEYEVSIKHLHMSASIGIAVYPDDGDSAVDLLNKAGIAMSAAKKAGKNCWRFYEPIFLQEAYEKMMLTNDLHRALERGELVLHYQPQLTVRGTIVGFEALLRWNSLEHGCVSPVRFIPLTEESGLIVPIGKWVLQQACQFARRMADMGKGAIHVAVNISPRQLLTDDFVATVCRSIADSGIEPEQLEIEITESALIESMEESICKLAHLRDRGVMISLDDFGTGYSSLTYLRRLPVGVLKIDKSFIDKIVSDKIQLQMVGSIIDLAHALGLTIVAEGVETEEQLTLLTQCRCDCIQGYIFSKPIAEHEAIKFLDYGLPAN